MAMGVHAARTRGDEPVVRYENDARGPEADEGLARPDHAGADPAAHVVACASDHRCPMPEMPALGVLAPERADDLRALGKPRQPPAVYSNGGEDGWAPFARDGVHEERRAGVGPVAGDLARQAQTHEILRQ